VKRSSHISQVKDLFPELGEGFIEACLDYHNMNTEAVINILLENSIPDRLNDINRSLERP
jgi:activating signal cointegrator complex subunit 2